MDKIANFFFHCLTYGKRLETMNYVVRDFALTLEYN